MAETKLAAEVKRFSGFIAIDGSTHNSKKAAIEHSTEIKIAAAVLEVAEGVFVARQNAISDVGPLLQFGTAEELAEVLLEARAPLLKAFDQQVRLRSPGGGRPKKTAKPVESGGAA